MDTQNRNKKPTAMRLSEEAVSLIEEIRKKMGLTKTAVIEVAVRRLAEQERVGQHKEA